MRFLHGSRWLGWVLFGVVVQAACAHSPVPVPREKVEAEVSRAEVAFGALRARLMTRLTTAIADSGLAGAIDVCGTEAQAMANEIGRANGVTVGRTSFRLRNHTNAPKPWAKAFVDSAENRPMLFDLGKSVGVLAPIPAGALCVSCHGPRDRWVPEVQAVLAKRYPKDEAVNFTEGDLRGYFWAEVPKR